MSNTRPLWIIGVLLTVAAVLSLANNGLMAPSNQDDGSHEFVIVKTLTQISNVFVIDMDAECLDTEKQFLNAYAGLIALKDYVATTQDRSRHLPGIIQYVERYFEHYHCEDRYVVDQEVMMRLMTQIISDVDNDTYYAQLEDYLEKVISK